MRLFAAGFFYLPVYLLAAEKARTPIEATLPQTLLYTLGFASLWVGALLDRSDRKRVLVLSTLGQAALALALLTGKEVAEEVVARVFQNFCVGK